MPYITLENVADYLNVDLTFEGEALGTDLITGAIAQLESACNRTWTVTNPVTETFDGGTSRLFPKSLPITGITSLTLDGSRQVQGKLEQQLLRQATWIPIVPRMNQILGRI